MSTTVKTASPAVTAPAEIPQCKTIASRFCFCGSLRTGAQVASIVAALFSAAAVGLDVATLFLIGTDYLTNGALAIAFAFIAVNVFWMIVHIVGAVGVFRRKLPLIRFHAIAYNVYAGFFVVRLAMNLISGSSSMLTIGIGALSVALHIYFAVIVWSHYQLERFNAANAVTVVVSTADVDMEAGAAPTKA
ncbi:hypothetical protein HDU96_003886 [Phlyctochytrium bullatum]|nr:hypothetical protein HDU96_003886 [Phlyctochytrium bullatum]